MLVNDRHLETPAISTHVEQPSFRECLLRLTYRITANPALREDLFQEALIHLWLTENHRPGQTESWYLQSCKFHLQHYLASGRSVDSLKRRADLFPFHSEGNQQNVFPDQPDPADPVPALVSAREIISLLSSHLPPHEKAVLDCLADGLGLREIGRRLNISHTLALKRRHKIASLLIKLETPGSLFRLFHPPAGANGTNHANGKAWRIDRVSVQRRQFKLAPGDNGE